MLSQFSWSSPSCGAKSTTTSSFSCPGKTYDLGLAQPTKLFFSTTLLPFCQLQFCEPSRRVTFLSCFPA